MTVRVIFLNILYIDISVDGDLCYLFYKHNLKHILILYYLQSFILQLNLFKARVICVTDFIFHESQNRNHCLPKIFLSMAMGLSREALSGGYTK